MKQFDIVLPCRRVEADVVLSNAKDILPLSAKHVIYIHESDMYIPEIENTICINNCDLSISSSVNIYNLPANELYIRENIHSLYTLFENKVETTEVYISQPEANLSQVRYRYVHEMDGDYLYTEGGEVLPNPDADGIRWSTYDDMTLTELDYLTST